MSASVHPANEGLNFTFDGFMTREVLENYLSRAMTCSGCFDGLSKEFEEISPEVDQCLRMILNTGVKYVGRAGCQWILSGRHAAEFPRTAENAAKVHAADPEIILEACIFECICTGVNEIAVPAWVFEEFGLPVEDRHFVYEDMIYTDGKWNNVWGEGRSVPDVTRPETQMYFYYLARMYIDAGFEAFHMGQYYLIGAYDKGFVCYTAVHDRIRAYAKKHARRHFVLINAHCHGETDANGMCMFDFHEWPSRGKVPDGSVAHLPAPGNPQEIELVEGYMDSIYHDSHGGKTYSGWECEFLPYTVELDNYSPECPRNTPGRWWGYDEISWFINQPDDYRADWLGYAYRWVREHDPDGHFMMPGVRVASHFDTATDTRDGFMYFNYDRACDPRGTGDENAIREIFIRDRKER